MPLEIGPTVGSAGAVPGPRLTRRQAEEGLAVRGRIFTHATQIALHTASVSCASAAAGTQGSLEEGLEPVQRAPHSLSRAVHADVGTPQCSSAIR